MLNAPRLPLPARAIKIVPCLMASLPGSVRGVLLAQGGDALRSALFGVDKAFRNDVLLANQRQREQVDRRLMMHQIRFLMEELNHGTGLHKSLSVLLFMTHSTGPYCAEIRREGWNDHWSLFYRRHSEPNFGHDLAPLTESQVRQQLRVLYSNCEAVFALALHQWYEFRGTFGRQVTRALRTVAYRDGTRTVTEYRRPREVDPTANLWAHVVMPYCVDKIVRGARLLLEEDPDPARASEAVRKLEANEVAAARAAHP